MTSDKHLSQTRLLDELIASSGKMDKRKSVTHEDVLLVKKLLRNNTNLLWNYLYKKEKSKAPKSKH